MTRIEHPANTFRNYRSKYIAIARKHGFEKAFYILEKDRSGFSDLRIYTGLLCELVFFQAKQNEMMLTPTLDSGDHCDFTGQYNNGLVRFDVTSSLEYKQLEDYAEEQKLGFPYYVVLVDPKTKAIEQIIDINLPFCPICGGRILTVLLEREDCTQNGTPSPSQKVISLCSDNYGHVESVGTYEYHVPKLSK